MTPQEIVEVIHANGLYHGTMAVGVVMDMEHLKQLVAIVEDRTKSRILERLNKAAEDNGEEL